MITRREFAGALSAGLTLAVVGCADVDPYRYRFKLTVEVETPSGIRRGSSVYEVWANTNFPGSGRQFWGQKGEAVAVELPNGKTMFALMKTEAIYGDMASLSMATLDPDFSNAMVESGKRLSEQKTSMAVLVERQNYPLLVTFKDIKNPTSVERVDPDDLAASFGAGHQLKAITVQVTEEPVTVGIGQRLGWLEALGRERSTLIPNPPKYLNEITDPVQQVTPGYFTTELYK